MTRRKQPAPICLTCGTELTSMTGDCRCGQTCHCPASTAPRGHIHQGSQVICLHDDEDAAACPQHAELESFQ